MLMPNANKTGTDQDTRLHRLLDARSEQLKHLIAYNEIFGTRCKDNDEGSNEPAHSC